VKNNQPHLKEAVELWLVGQGVMERPPDVQEVTKGHGRLEVRALWLVESEALGAYLAQAYDWPAVRWCGVLKRKRRRGRQATWEEETVIWIAGGHLTTLTAQQALAWLRGHWEIENRLFWVRDVSQDEDRLHGRAIGLALSALRNVAINILRHLGYRYIPDGWRAMAARPDRGLVLLKRC
jgi:hypothetical protein